MKKITAGRWKYNLKCGDELRSAIHAGDSIGVLNLLLKAYSELKDAGLIDEYDFESYTEDFELYLYDDFDESSWEDPEEIVDYELSNFYDLCDNIGVWIGV